MSAPVPGLASVVIPCYNGEPFVAEAVDSALAQTYRPVEVIAVDDGSTDGSPVVLARYGERIRVVRQPNRGLPAARNAGIRVARGEYLAFLDADDWWASEFLARSVTALTASGAGIAYCGWQNVGLPGRRGEPFIPPDYQADPDRLATLVAGPRWPVHAAVVRRAVVEAVGGFDERLKSCEDFAFWIRAATCYPLVRVPEALAFYRFHGGQMTRDRWLVLESHWRVQQTFLRERPEVALALGRRRVRALTHGELLRKGFDAYWRRDLPTARAAFRKVMGAGYGRPREWGYMLPALLPLPLHRVLLRLLERGAGASAGGGHAGA